VQREISDLEFPAGEVHVKRFVWEPGQSEKWVLETEGSRRLSLTNVPNALPKYYENRSHQRQENELDAD